MGGDEELNNTLCMFWEVEQEDTFSKVAMAADEKSEQYKI